MSGSRTDGIWAFSPSLNARYRIDTRRSVYILEDGTEVPIPPAANTSATTASPPPARRHRQAASTDHRVVPSRSTLEANNLTERFDSLSISRQYSENEQQLSWTIPETTGRRRDADQPVVEAHDRTTQVNVVVQRAPAQAITDPTLYKVGVDAHRKLLPTVGEEEKFDPDYRLRGTPKKFFIIGRVFLILWAEPAGESAVSSQQPPALHIRGRFGQQVFSKVRRFVVIRENDLSCSALPVLTYSGRGASQRDQSEHGIIYTGKQEPARPHHERGLQPIAIRVDPDIKGDKLDVLSRINYGNVYTIEHNIKVKPFGMVNRDSIQPLVNQFGSVWISKVGQRTGQAVQVLRATQELRPDLYASQSAVPTDGNAVNNLPPSSRTGLTPAQERAYERHGTVAYALQQRSATQSSSVGAASVTTAERAPRVARIEAVAPTEDVQLSPETKKELRSLFEHHKQSYLANDYNEEEAQAAAAAHVRTAVDRIRFSKAREHSQASSRASADPRSSSGSLSTPSTSYMTSVSPSNRRGSVTQEHGQSSTSARRPSFNRNPHTLSQTAPRPMAIVTSTTSSNPTEMNTIRSIMAEGWSSESANLIMHATRRNYSGEAARRIARLVEQGLTLPEAMARVNEEVANAMLHAPGRGKGRAQE